MGIDPSATIHPAAIVETGATVGPGCVIGPFAHIGPEVTLGAGVEVKSHGIVTGCTDVGEGSVVFSFAVVGEIPQDLKYGGEHTRLSVGARCRIREGATLNTGTQGGGGITRVGDECLLMTGAHVGHDAQVGNRVILANQAAIAGHCIIGDDVIVGGLSGVHQFVRIGRGAIIGAVTMVTNDVIPHGLVQAPRGELDGLNLVGLKRRGVGRADITALRAAYQMLAQGDGSFLDRARKLGDETDSAHVREMTDFILGASDRSFLTPR
jgi:UDP-N-acetylglucosamine acyltransferase